MRIRYIVDSLPRNQSELIQTIASDCVVHAELHLAYLPREEREEYVRKLRTHLRETYSEYARLEIAGASKRNLAMHVLTAALIALFGLPLGLGGVSLVFGIIVACAAVVLAYYVFAGSMLIAASLVALLAFARLFAPPLWDQLIDSGYIHIGVPMFDQFSVGLQASILMWMAVGFFAAGFGLWKVGKYPLRGVRQLFRMASDWARRGGKAVGRGITRSAELTRR